MNEPNARRVFLFSTTIAGTSLLLGACAKRGQPEAVTADPRLSPTQTTGAAAPKKEDDEDEVTATEDLMREHGVIRRVLVVYRECALRLRTKGNVPPEALQRAARLMRDFGEDYHEKQLEELHLFPAVRKGGGVAASEIDALLAQHQRGREITEYVLASTQKAIASAASEPLARSLESFARMYEVHAAHEDTIVFPAWKKTLSKKELHEMGERFEEIEHKTFGKDGFDDAVDRIAAIEKLLGIDLGAMIAPPPPKP